MKFNKTVRGELKIDWGRVRDTLESKIKKVAHFGELQHMLIYSGAQDGDEAYQFFITKTLLPLVRLRNNSNQK